MRQLLITIAAVLLVGWCTHTSKSSSQSNKNKKLESKLENLLTTKLAKKPALYEFLLRLDILVVS